MARRSIRNTLTAVVVGLLAATAVGASASPLGGIDTCLGADATDVSSCDTDGIDVDWEPDFNAGTGEYGVQFVLSDIDLDCRLRPYKITISRTDGTRAFGNFPRFPNGGTYDRQPGPGFDPVFRAGYVSGFSAASIDSIAIEIGGD